MPIPLAIRELILDEAMILLGVDAKETPDGSNAGFFIDMMKKRFGGGLNWAWCMYLVQFCVYRAYTGYLKPKSPLAIYDANGNIDLRPEAGNGHVYTVWHNALRQEAFEILSVQELIDGAEAPLGTIWVRYDEDRKGHTGIVVSHNVDSENPLRGVLRAIEGNVSNRVDTREHILEDLIEDNLRGIIT